MSEPTRLTVSQKALYGMGNMGGNFLNLVFSMWIYKRYCPPEGEGTALVPILWMTWAFAIGRLVDAAADPLVGYWSDRTRSRYGRRIPFILFGGLPLCLVFFLIWVPPTGWLPPGSAALFAWLSVMMALFWFLFTVALCPYLALLPEIAKGPAERLDLAVYQSIFMLAGSAAVMVGSPFLLGAMGFAGMGGLFAVLSLAAVYAPLAAVWSLPRKETEEEGYGIWTALKWSFQNGPFVIYVTSSFFFNIGYNTLIMGMPYIVTVILKKPDSYAGVVMGGTGAAAAAGFVLIRKLTRKREKSDVYAWAMLALAALTPFIWVFGRFDCSFQIGAFTADEFILTTVLFALAGFPVAALMTLPAPLLSDAIDLDELRTGKRREAMYFGAQGLLQKAGAGLSGVTMGLLFDRFGYSAARHGGIDLIGPVASALLIAGYLVFRTYPLTDARCEEIRRQLARSKGC